MSFNGVTLSLEGSDLSSPIIYASVATCDFSGEDVDLFGKFVDFVLLVLQSFVLVSEAFFKSVDGSFCVLLGDKRESLYLVGELLNDSANVDVFAVWHVEGNWLLVVLN